MKVLTAIPGIGRYSAAIIFGQSTPPIDAWSVVIMSELYHGRTPANSRQEIEKVQEDSPPAGVHGAGLRLRISSTISITSRHATRFRGKR